MRYGGFENTEYSDAFLGMTGSRKVSDKINESNNYIT
jgi:hypothetical protein